MSGLEVVAAVSAVISAFHGGSELVKHIKKKRKSKKEQAYREKALQESLQSGEIQVNQRYHADYREVGPRFRTGDAIARDRLLHIAVMMQAEIIRSLQIAIQYENAVLDLTLLNETSIMNRRDTITALDELKQRIYMSLPLEPALRPPTIDMERKTSMDSVRTFMTANTMAVDFVPPAVTLTEPDDELHHGIGKLLSVARRPSSRRQIENNRVELLPNFDWLSRHISTRDGSGDLIPEFNALSITVSAPPFAVPQPQQPPQAPRHDSVMRQDSTSTRSIQSYSDSSNRTSSVPSISAQELHSPTSPQPDYSPYTAPSPITPDSPFQGFHPGYERSVPAPTNRKSSYSNPDRSSPFSRKTNTIMMPGNPQSMLGRPSKSNNYWGFCKGAWTARENLPKGIALVTVPQGMYGSIKVWQCRSCAFKGKSFGTKPNFFVDPNIHVSGCGLRYKWAFLAKSHVRKPGAAADEGESYNYGCILCSVGMRGTPIFGNAETLMNHIYLEHSTSMTRDMQEAARCVFGRSAAASEDFDINIPVTMAEKEGS